MAMAMTSSLFASSSAFHDSSSLLREEPTCLFNFHNHNNTTRRKCHKAQSPRQHRQSANRNLLPVCALRGIPNTIPAFPNDPFLSRLAEMVSPSSSSSSSFPDNPNSEGLPLLDLVSGPSKLMAAPGQAERSAAYNEHKPRRPPPDLPSLLLNSRIVYIGMPLVPAVTELVIAELLYLQWLDPRQPTYVYINSTGTSRADGETVGMETEGFAIYDTMMLVKNEIQTVAVGAAIGQACLLLAAGTKGRRYMMPHATAMIQQPRLPSTGQMPAIDVHIRAKEVVNNRDTLVKLLAKHTENSFEKVSKVMQRPYYMDPRKAIEFGVADKILWRGQEAMSETLSPEQWDKGAGIRVMERPMPYANGSSALG